MSDSRKPICIIGSIVYDIVMKLKHLPSVGETVTGDGFANFIGGKGLNQAMQIHRLDYPVDFFGRVGNDKYGDEVLRELAARNFPVDGIKIIDGEHTAIGMIFVAPDGKNMIGGYHAANINFPASEIDSRTEASIRNAKIVSIQNETPNDVNEKVLRLAKDAGVTTVINAAPWRNLPDHFQDIVDYWLVNEVEAGQFANCTISDSDDCNALLRHPQIKSGQQVWVVTLGEKGAVVVDSSGLHPIPGIKVDAVDSTGAGDSFTGGFAVGIAEGLSPLDAAIFANRVAAQSVTKLGGMPGLPRRSEIVVNI